MKIFLVNPENMDIYDDTEICELIGIFILKSLEDKIDKQDTFKTREFVFKVYLQFKCFKEINVKY